VALTIFTHKGADNWESHKIRGALLYKGITSRVCDLSFIDDFRDDLCVVLLSSRDRFNLIELCSATNTTFLFAGHYITLQYLQGGLQVPENVVLVYGEPYRTVPQLAKDKELLKQSRGTAVLGDLYDQREYVPAPGTYSTNTSLVVTSLGCEKRCGYCTYGATNFRLYGHRFSRRSRPWQDLERELIQLLDRGVDLFQMTASQFLSNDPEQNIEIRSLAYNWDCEANGRPKVAFTVSPLEVLNNRSILKAMSRAFRVYPRLSIDSFDDQALALFDREYDAAAALKAVKFLAALKLPFKVNYIFIRPGIDIARLDNEIAYLKLLASATSYMSSYEKLMLAYDVFSSSLLVYEGAPIAFEKGIRPDYEATLPMEMVAVMASIQSNLRKLIEAVRKGDEREPLMSLLKEIEGDLKHLPRCSHRETATDEKRPAARQFHVNR
jgi:hypothetical protein